MSEQSHRIRTMDDSRLEVCLDRYEDLLTHEADVALVVREDDRLCMCLDLETARALGELLLRLSKPDEGSTGTPEADAADHPQRSNAAQERAATRESHTAMLPR